MNRVGKSVAKVVDINVERKGRILREHLSRSPFINNQVPTFSIVEFNVTELCNRKCVFCPRSDPKKYPNRRKFLEPSLYEKIMKELSEFDYSGKILYSAFGEPLLHKELERLIALSKQYCPKSHVEIVTNGDFVTVKRLHTLFDAGLDTIVISMYDGPHQIEHFTKIREAAGLRDDQLILRVRYLPPKQHYGIILSNRAGMIDLSEIGVKPLAEPLKKKCYYPFYQLMVDYDGTVLLCPHDWTKCFKAGDLKRQKLLEIWTGKALTCARKRLSNSDRNFEPCKVCDAKGTLMGGKHFEQWQRYYRENDDAQ